MKKLIPGLLVILILVCSCSAKKSFLHQRYTNYGHKKHSTIAENKAPVSLETKTSVDEVPETIVVNAEREQAKPLVYTRTVVNKVILPVALKGKQKVAGLFNKNSVQSDTKLSKTKSSSDLVKKHEKRGLLWGLIDAILAMILLVVFVGLLVWLLFVLT